MCLGQFRCNCQLSNIRFALDVGLLVLLV